MQNNKGFTIIEIGITLLVVAILVGALASQLISFRTVTTQTSNNQQVAVVQQMVDMEFSRRQLAERKSTCEENYVAAVNTVKEYGDGSPMNPNDKKKLPNGATYKIIMSSGTPPKTETFPVQINGALMDSKLLSAEQACGVTRKIGSAGS